MELFWEKGYEAISIQDLLDGMGINRFRLHDTFKGKRELFEAALVRYGEEQVEPQVREMREGRDGYESVRRYFDALVARATGPAGWRGCLMVNTAVELAPGDRGAAERVKAFLEVLEEAFYRALVRARKAGEVGSVLPPECWLSSWQGTSSAFRSWPERGRPSGS
jgi:TetR/AcrR family transcriptional repressor of nem operon